MVEQFGTEWAEQASALWPHLPPVPGANGVVSLAVAVAPRRETAIHWRYEDGQVVAGGVGAGGDPRLSLTIGAADAPELLSGAVEPSVAFMRGRLKTTGDGELLLAFLSATVGAGFDEWRRRVGSLAGPGLTHG